MFGRKIYLFFLLFCDFCECLCCCCCCWCGGRCGSELLELCPAQHFQFIYFSDGIAISLPELLLSPYLLWLCLFYCESQQSKARAQCTKVWCSNSLKTLFLHLAMSLKQQQQEEEVFWGDTRDGRTTTRRKKLLYFVGVSLGILK